MQSDNLNFYSLSSGSSGNCYFLGNAKNGLLIDAGIPAGNIRKFLKNKDIPLHAIMGVLVTHNHTDHTKGLELLARKNNMPVYTTPKIWGSIVSRQSRIFGIKVNEIDQKKTFNLAGFEIEAFPVSHDAPETIGFHICSRDFKITIATDLGQICQTAAPYIEAANLLVIESNYDEKMLLQGSYPHFLKARIMSDQGHLGNRQVSSFLAAMNSKNLRHICLAHLSNNNNSPEIALQNLQQAYTERDVGTNIQPQVSVLNRNSPSDVIRLN